MNYDMCVYEYKGIEYKSAVRKLFSMRSGKKIKVWVCKNDPEKAITNQWYWFGLSLGVVMIPACIYIMYVYYL
ncbi:MAG: hypothetical protein ACI4E1_00960 [Lachnospira sp.]